MGLRVDIHSHYLSSNCLDLVGSNQLKANQDRPISASPLLTRFVDLDDRAAWMKRNGIDLQILGPEMTFAFGLRGEEEFHWARIVNDSVERDIENRAEFAALALLPMSGGGEVAAAELEKRMHRTGFCGGMIHSRPPGGLAAQHFDALWDAAVTLDAPLLLHSVETKEDERMLKYQLDARIGRCHDVSVAAAELIFGRVLDRFPNLKMVLVMGGGSLPFLSARLDADHALRSNARTTSGFPSEYLRRLYFDSLVFGRHQLRLLIQLAGIDRVMFGSDWPIPLFEDDPIGFLRDHCRGDRSEDVAGILGDNARRVFLLDDIVRTFEGN